MVARRVANGAEDPARALCVLGAASSRLRRVCGDRLLWASQPLPHLHHFRREFRAPGQGPLQVYCAMQNARRAAPRAATPAPLEGTRRALSELTPEAANTSPSLRGLRRALAPGSGAEGGGELRLLAAAAVPGAPPRRLGGGRKAPKHSNLRRL